MGAMTSADTPQKTPGSARRGTVREHRGRLRLRAYAGQKPTGGDPYIYDYLPLGAADKDIGRALTALVSKADELAETRRARRDDPYAEPAPVARARRDRTVAHALETWWNAHGSTLDGAAEVRRNLDAYLIPKLGPVALWRLRPALDAADTETDPDLVDLSAFYRELLAGGGVGGGGRPH
ncbi:MAG TPA: hypothetical protein VGP90_03765, partial [Acidimicrobiia bacterium]|nr:hypothetical protein [Acidimicrobiia bacterium]